MSVSKTELKLDDLSEVKELRHVFVVSILEAQDIYQYTTLRLYVGLNDFTFVRPVIR
jgi:hypothetical protein